MKLEDLIMVVEHKKEKEANFLTDLQGYIRFVLKACKDSAADIAEALEQLYGTKKKNSSWSELCLGGNTNLRGTFCQDMAHLRGFLKGDFNEGEWFFDHRSSKKECLEVISAHGIKTDGYPLLMHYERLEHVFYKGELLHNMNGKDYRVLAKLGSKDLLLLGEDEQIVVGINVELFERSPMRETPSANNTSRGIEWGKGIYLGYDITKLDFDILRQEYGEPLGTNGTSFLRDKIEREFWMHKNVEQKEGLGQRIRAAAKESLNQLYGTCDPEVFVTMLNKGMYDPMYAKKEEQKKVTGASR